MAPKKKADESAAHPAGGGPQDVGGYTPPDVSDELEQGFVGNKVDPRPNSEHSLESGPDSPSPLDQALDAKREQVGALESSNK